MNEQAPVKAATPSNEFGPVGALRVIQQVCGDVGMTPAQRLAVVQVILYADNGTGLAWAAYRTIMQKTGLAPGTIRAALRYAEGRYLNRHTSGRNGAIQYRIALHGMKRASKIEAPTASHTEAPALQSALPGASHTEAILAPVSNPKKKGAADKPPPAESTNGAGARLLGLFAELFKTKVGEPFAGNKPALGRFLKTQAASIGEPEAELRGDAGGYADDPRAVAGGAILAEERAGGDRAKK